MIKLLQFYQQQLQAQNTPQRLFEQTPVLRFEPEQKLCPVDNQKLHVLKTGKRLIKAIGMGTFWAHYTIRYCKKHSELGSWHSKELHELVAPNSNVAYNVMVEVGKLRFMENRQVLEIQSLLSEKHSVDISRSEIELLIDKFIFYLEAVHQQSTKFINQRIQAQGGYILHLDSTCEGDSPKLASSMDAISGFVLYSAKLASENTADVVTFLKEIKQRFGTPHAVVSDMSTGIGAAVHQVFGSIPHYLCHFHFLTAIGKLLFEKEHAALRKALSNAGISAKLKALRRKIKQRSQALDEMETYLAAPEKLGKTREATEILAYYLILWILDHASEGNGYGFPFDQRYLNFYERLKQAQNLINEVKDYYSVYSENDTILWKLYHLMAQIVGDSTLHHTVMNYKSKLKVFSELRWALAVAPEQNNNGLTRISVTSSNREVQSIRAAVENFMDTLNQKIQTTTDLKLRHSFIKVKERIERYWQKLFADPFMVKVDGQERLFFVHRTNNIMENHFRQLNYGYRRIHGNHSVRRNLENIPEQLPLVENLRNPNYIELVFKDESKIAQKFSEIEISKIKKISSEHRNKKVSLCSRKIKCIIRQPDWQKRLRVAFAAVAG